MSVATSINTNRLVQSGLIYQSTFKKLCNTVTPVRHTKSMLVLMK